MLLLHKNYAVTTKLLNPISIVPKCPKDTSAPVPKWRDTSDIKSEIWKVQSVLGPKCLYTLLNTAKDQRCHCRSGNFRSASVRRF